ncbi:hypothetical protein CALCODRAFT_498393 [Calocera cornea HHB12733]|uniref:Uncharacterized protein n=1 Tax=Calocera cornea HHB12733 TaxID=1353952 RepID=A0A165EVZ9_9BASI|nr:hypothetical protein CALCODRAFT_498393 [Calocera cornea HHB12733]
MLRFCMLSPPLPSPPLLFLPSPDAPDPTEQQAIPHPTFRIPIHPSSRKASRPGQR